MPKRYTADELIAAFWSKVDVREEDECWPWLATRDSCGYGQVRHQSTNMQRSHRVAYRLTNGEFEPTLHICHTCDNPSCCNPAHLIAETRNYNMQDMYNKERHFRPKGSLSVLSKLNDDDKRKILTRLRNGETQVNIAKDYNVHQGTISRIKLSEKEIA